MGFKYNPFTNRLDIVGSGGSSPTTPAGANTEIQFNNAGAFGASSNFTYNSATHQLLQGFDGSNYFTTIPSAAGVINFNAVGTDPRFVFADFVSYPQVAYVGPAGSDSNTGLTAASPFATLTKANTVLGGVGEIVMLGGDYRDITLDLANVIKLKIKGRLNEHPRIFLGERHTSAFVNHAGNVWKKVITTVIPLAVWPNTGFNHFVFELNTTEGAITIATAHPSQKAQLNRLAHFRLKQVGSIGAVVAGTYFYEVGTATIYFQRTDSANPNSTGSGIEIPSQTATQCFVYDSAGVFSTHSADIEIEDVEVYFGLYCMNFAGVRRAITRNVVVYGGSSSGILCHNTLYNENWYPEFAANGADGHPVTGSSGPASLYGQSESYDYWPWGHDNGDQAITTHALSIGKCLGGLIEQNYNGGILGGGQFEAIGVYSRNNGTAGFAITISPGNGELGVTMLCDSCTSVGDYIGYYATGSPGHLIVTNCSVYNATFIGIAANATNTIDVYNTFGSGNANLIGGGGTINLIDNGTFSKFAVKQSHSVRGSNAVLQVDPFQSTISLGNPIILLGGESMYVNLGITSIGWGYTDASNDLAPVETGIITSGGGNTHGDYFIATRSVDTNTAPTIRFRVFGSGVIRHEFSPTVYLETTIGSTGTALFNLVGSAPLFTFNDDITLQTNGSYTGAQFTINDSLTQFYLGINGSANASILSTRAISMVTGVGSDVVMQPQTAKLYILSTGATDTSQLRIGYDSSNYYNLHVSSAGLITFNAVGASASFVFADAVSVPDQVYGAGWNGSVEVPTKNAVYDKIESLLTGTGIPVVIQVAVSDETTDLTTGTSKITFRMPYAMTLTSVRASVNTAPTGSILIVDINESGSTIMTTNKLSIDATEKTSTTAATAPGITDSALADDAEITIDIDQIGSTIAGKGLKVVLIGTRT